MNLIMFNSLFKNKYFQVLFYKNVKNIYSNNVGQWPLKMQN